MNHATQSPKPIQLSGDFSYWRSADGQHRFGFLKLDLACEPSTGGGILLLCDSFNQVQQLFEVTSLRREMPALLKGNSGWNMAYWHLESNDSVRADTLAKLGKQPFFFC